MAEAGGPTRPVRRRLPRMAPASHPSRPPVLHGGRRSRLRTAVVTPRRPRRLLRRAERWRRIYSCRKPRSDARRSLRLFCSIHVHSCLLTRRPPRLVRHPERFVHLTPDTVHSKRDCAPPPFLARERPLYPLDELLKPLLHQRLPQQTLKVLLAERRQRQRGGAVPSGPRCVSASSFSSANAAPVAIRS